MTVHLLHGFNVSDGGKQSVGQMADDLQQAGFTDIRLHDYGWTGPIRLRLRNKQIIEKLSNEIKPGDMIVAHSNGAYIAWQLADRGLPLAAVVAIQPALRRDTSWPAKLPVLCIFNRRDWVVELGRMWGRLITRVRPSKPHGWGAAGRHGFTLGQLNVTNWRTDNHAVHPVAGHSGIFRTANGAAYLANAACWMKRRANI